jgi:hypothetical protein
VPLLINGESGIIAGHGRVLAARKLGMTEVPCVSSAPNGAGGGSGMPHRRHPRHHDHRTAQRRFISGRMMILSAICIGRRAPFLIDGKQRAAIRVQSRELVDLHLSHDLLARMEGDIRPAARGETRVPLRACRGEPEGRCMRFRIGVNVGDVMVKDGDIFHSILGCKRSLTDLKARD